MTYTITRNELTKLLIELEHTLDSWDYARTRTIIREYIKQSDDDGAKPTPLEASKKGLKKTV